LKTGIVLDILRCSLYDGPGIRTTVFLKGCPLACIWCHNPESQSRNPVLVFNARKCVHCGECARVCPSGVHEVTAEGYSVNRGHCATCGRCVDACSEHGLEIKGRSMTVQEIIAEVKKDADFYSASGGGVTISGGEPMSQPEFAREIAGEAKRIGIHTALETSGMAPAGRYREILPHIDLFLFDYKATDPVRHAALTGVSNVRILENLDMLYSAGARIRLRCPLVPGINDCDVHLRGIAAMQRRYPRLLGIDIMPYHNMGNEKARRSGVPVLLSQPGADAATIEGWISRLAALGCNAGLDGRAKEPRSSS